MRCLSIALYVFLVFLTNCLQRSADSQQLGNQERQSVANHSQKGNLSPSKGLPTAKTQVSNTAHNNKTRQTRFGLERVFARKTPVPNEIWRLIVDNEENDNLKLQISEQNDPDYWVSGSEIDINGDNKEDFVVMAHQPPLAGANVTTFWVFLNENGKFRCVLKTSELELDFSKNRNRGFRSITGISFTAKKGIEVRFVYDGNSFQKVSQKITNLR